VWAISVFLWNGDLDSAEELTDRFIAHAESHSLGPYLTVGRGYKGVLAIRQGDAKRGVDILQASLAVLHAARYELITTEFNMSLVQGLSATGRNQDASELLEQTIRLVEQNGDDCYVPELLRVKGGLLLSLSRRRLGDAEKCFTQSLHVSRRQGARAWELRAATDLATLWAGQRRSEDARALLRPVVAQFAEGVETADLKAARSLLARL
jgi:predicted ATPase